MTLVDALTSAVLPVLSVAAVGYFLGSRRDIDVDPLNVVTIYVLTPALVFYSIATSDVSGATAALVFGGVFVFVALMAIIATGVGRLTNESGETLGALVLTSTFPNAGNFGIPLCAFAFGAIGRSTAVLFLTAQAVTMYTFGVFVASRGQAGGVTEAIREVFGLPLVYALAAGGLARALDVLPPTDTAIMQTVRLTGDAAIPVMLLLLGIQLANTKSGAAIRRVTTANALKLAVAPAVGLAFVLAIGLPLGLPRDVARVFVLETATPAAITPLMLTIEFSGDPTDDVSAPDYVSTAILTTTLAATVTVTFVIWLLRSGWLF